MLTEDEVISPSDTDGTSFEEDVQNIVATPALDSSFDFAALLLLLL